TSSADEYMSDASPESDPNGPAPDHFQVSSDLSSFYGEFYDGQSTWRELGAIGKVDNIQALSGGVPHAEVIDIGAGEGSILWHLSQRGFGERYWALDISPSAIEALQGRGIEGLQDSQVFDGYHVPYEDQRFDLAILSHVVEHVEFPRKLLAEAARVAKYVVVEVPLEENQRAPEDYRVTNIGHINFYSHRTIRKLLQSCGYEVLEQNFHQPNYQALRHLKGWRALLQFVPKEIYLRLFRSWALNRYTYQTTLMCKSPQG
ncbi:MAG: class I SAM-dependent methyltransferase, partial [Myxococcota bacterium]|nr:class I SAM-dependent methyltransferase [Myxococcota bacterium]